MQIDLWLALVGAFGFVAVVTWALAQFVSGHFSPERARFLALTAATPALAIERTGLSETPDPVLQRLSKAIPRSPETMGRIRRRLAMAGYYDLRTAVFYSVAELMMPLVLASIVVLYFGVTTGWLGALLAAVVGYVLPGFWLRRKTSQRKMAIQNGLPDVLDLFVVCMQAGSSLEQAIVKAGDELQFTHPAVTRELRLVTTEIRAGKPRSVAFKNFEKRTGVDDVRALVAMLIQTDRFGTSVSQALRTHASAARTQRRQQAEERAGKVGVKLVFPLVFCSFPAVYIVCIGPVVVQIYRVFVQ
jgi:tight adherence protein C